MPGLINVGAGLSAVGGAVSQFAGDIGVAQMKSALEDHAMELASQLATERQHQQNIETGVPYDVALKRLNVQLTGAKVGLLNEAFGEDGAGSPSQPPSDTSAPTAAAAAQTTASASGAQSTATARTAGGTFADMAKAVGMPRDQFAQMWLMNPDKAAELVAEHYKPQVTRAGGTVVQGQPGGGIGQVYANAGNEPLTDIGKLDEDLKAGRITQDQYNAAAAAISGKENKAEQQPGRWTRFEDTGTGRTGILNTVTGEKRFDTEASAAGLNPKDLTEPKMVEIDGANGDRTQVLGQQDKRSGQWVSADEKHSPLEGVTLPGGIGGVRSQVMMGRVLSSAHTVANELENMVALPGNASAGTLGIPEGSGILGSLKANLVRTVQPQEVQSAQVSMAGLSRALAQMESAGLAPGGALVGQMDRLTLQAGDSELTRLQKLATMRQTAEGILDSMANQPAATAAQRKEIDGLKARLAKSVPFEPIDVITLARSNSPGETLGDIAKKRGLGEKKQVGNAPKFPTPPQGAIEELRARGRSAIPQFDQIFGAGAGEKALGQ